MSESESGGDAENRADEQFRPKLDVDELKSRLVEKKLVLNDRRAFALNLGSIFKDVARDYPDFTMRRLFFEVFEQEQLAESAYKKRHSFIWLNIEADKRDPAELRSRARDYLSFLEILTERMKTSARLSDEEKADALLKRFISGSSFDYQGAMHDRQEHAFRAELDLRCSQIIEKFKDSVDANWWFEWVEQAKLPDSTLSVDGQTYNLAAPRVRLAEISSRLDSFDYGRDHPIIGCNSIQLEISPSQPMLESSVAVSIALQEAICEHVLGYAADSEFVMRHCGSEEGRAIVASFGDADFKDEYLLSLDPMGRSSYSSPDPDFEELAAWAMEYPKKMFFFNQESSLDLELRFDVASNDWKPVIVWNFLPILNGSYGLQTHQAPSERPVLDLIPLMEFSGGWWGDSSTDDGFVVFADASSLEGFQESLGECEYASETVNIVTVRKSYFGIRPRKVLSGLLPNSTDRSFFPPDENFYSLMFSQTGELYGDMYFSGVLNEKHDIFSRIPTPDRSAPHSGAIAPGLSLSADLLTNLAFAEPEERIDLRLIEDAKNKYERHRKTFTEQQEKYLEAINKNLGDPNHDTK